jgi:hypothetical protein
LLSHQMHVSKIWLLPHRETNNVSMWTAMELMRHTSLTLADIEIPFFGSR